MDGLPQLMWILGFLEAYKIEGKRDNHCLDFCNLCLLL